MQIIETLLYPCYKMGCGSLLKRGEAESHDLNCTLENAADKQAVLHNNLLKNIEENFGSFIVQPEIVSFNACLLLFINFSSNVENIMHTFNYIMKFSFFLFFLMNDKPLLIKKCQLINIDFFIQ